MGTVSGWSMTTPAPEPRRPRGTGPGPTTSWWCCSTASTGTCSAPTASDEFDTPNLDAFAARSVRFTEHHTGSLPCMPARHDILCGALDFLWRPWGSVEIWEDAITRSLRAAGVTTQLISDHPHLFETGGENYHTDFSAWDYQRGHESDPWKTVPDPSWVGAPNTPGRHADALRRRRGVVPRRGRLPRPAHDGGRGRLDRRQRRPARPLLAVRRRVRSARAVRHARALGLALRPRLGGAAPDLAAVRAGRPARRACSTSARPGRSGRSTAPSCR